MKNGLHYLNDHGSRWVVYQNGKKEKVLVVHENQILERTAIEYKSFGNFASVVYYYKGKKYDTLNYYLVPNIKVSKQLKNFLMSKDKELYILFLDNCKDWEGIYSELTDIWSSFMWSMTPEGFNFWSKVSDEFNNYLKK
ncbi:MAG: hypothetical protein WCY37_05035 [Candidatus Dojkabacteria bacterium]